MMFGISIHLVSSLLKSLDGRFIKASQDKEEMTIEIGVPFDYSNKQKPKREYIKSPKFILKSIRIGNPESGIIGIRSPQIGP